jgi:hypothetical protein
LNQDRARSHDHHWSAANDIHNGIWANCQRPRHEHADFGLVRIALRHGLETEASIGAIGSPVVSVEAASSNYLNVIIAVGNKVWSVTGNKGQRVPAATVDILLGVRPCPAIG